MAKAERLKMGLVSACSSFLPDYKRDLYDLYGIEGLMGTSTGKRLAPIDSSKAIWGKVLVSICA